MVQLVIPFTRGGVAGLTPAQVDAIVACSSVRYDDCQEGSSTSEIVFSFCVFNAFSAAAACSKLGLSYAAFCGYNNTKRYKSIMTIRQSGLGAHSLQASENSVAGESDAGRVVLDMKGLAKAVADFKPTWCMPLYSPTSMEDVNPQQPTKRQRTAMARTAKWYDAAVKDGSGFPSRAMVAVPSGVVGALEDLSTLRTSDTEGASPIVFLENAGQGETLGARTSAMAAMARAVQKSNASDKDDEGNSTVGASTFVIAESVAALLLAALAGVSLVECDYGGVCARRGQAIDLSALIAVIRGVAPTQSSLSPFVIDLNDQRYQLDVSPLTTHEGNPCPCPCYSCARHTKSYLYHLLSVQEMNSETLLAIHNLSQIVQLCGAIQEVMGARGKVSAAEGKKRIQQALNLLAPS